MFGQGSTRAGKIIDIAVGGGVNQVNYVSFMLAPETGRSYRGIALSNAVRQTRADADAAAAAMGVNVTGVKEAVIGNSLPPVIYDNSLAMKSVGSTAPAVPIPVTPGDVKVAASVTVSYLFR